jgi:hypothetical protein
VKQRETRDHYLSQCLLKIQLGLSLEFGQEEMNFAWESLTKLIVALCSDFLQLIGQRD